MIANTASNPRQNSAFQIKPLADLGRGLVRISASLPGDLDRFLV